MTGTDRRILRTRRMLGEAVVSLIAEKGYDAVTIRDIAERADIAYATFFRHYDSKNALLMEQLEKALQDLEAEARSQADTYFLLEGQLVFEHIQANQPLYRSLLANVDVINSLKQMIITNIKPHASGMYAQYTNPALPLDLLLNHIVSSLLNLVSWWLDGDMVVPIAQMAEYYERLVIQSGWWAVSDAPPDVWILHRETP